MKSAKSYHFDQEDYDRKATKAHRWWKEYERYHEFSVVVAGPKEEAWKYVNDLLDQGLYISGWGGEDISIFSLVPNTTHYKRVKEAYDKKRWNSRRCLEDLPLAEVYPDTDALFEFYKNNGY